jgi:segregation and condensation protein A
VADEERSPRLTLAGFSGPLERLLILARARQIDLGRIVVADLVEQLAIALRQAGSGIPIGQQADWVVMTAWLLLLRSQLLLPADSPIQQAAEREADQLRGRLVALRDMQVLADWLGRQPRLGQDVFARGRPELPGTPFERVHQVDVVAFLWASLALFDDEVRPDSASAPYSPSMKLHAVDEARKRILRLLAAAPEGASLDRLLPEPTEGATHPMLLRRSAWASTLLGGLELVKQGEVVMRQAADFEAILVAPV